MLVTKVPASIPAESKSISGETVRICDQERPRTSPKNPAQDRRPILAPMPVTTTKSAPRLRATFLTLSLTERSNRLSPIVSKTPPALTTRGFRIFDHRLFTRPNCYFKSPGGPTSTRDPHVVLPNHSFDSQRCTPHQATVEIDLLALPTLCDPQNATLQFAIFLRAFSTSPKNMEDNLAIEFQRHQCQ